MAQVYSSAVHLSFIRHLVINFCSVSSCSPVPSAACSEHVSKLQILLVPPKRELRDLHIPIGELGLLLHPIINEFTSPFIILPLSSASLR